MTQVEKPSDILSQQLEIVYSKEIIEKAMKIWKIISNKINSDTKPKDKKSLMTTYLKYFCECIANENKIQFVKLGLPFDHKGQGCIDYAEIDYFERINHIAKNITEIYKNSVTFNILADGNLTYIPGISSPELVSNYQTDCTKYIKENNIPINIIDLVEYIKSQGRYYEYQNFYAEFLNNPNKIVENNILNIFINRLNEVKISDLGNCLATKLATSYLAHSYARNKIDLLPVVSNLGIGLTGIVRPNDSRLNFTTLSHTDLAPERVGLVWDLFKKEKAYYPYKSYTNTKGIVIQGINILWLRDEVFPVYDKSKKRILYYVKNEQNK